MIPNCLPELAPVKSPKSLRASEVMRKPQAGKVVRSSKGISQTAPRSSPPNSQSSLDCTITAWARSERGISAAPSTCLCGYHSTPIGPSAVPARALKPSRLVASGLAVSQASSFWRSATSSVTLRW